MIRTLKQAYWRLHLPATRWAVRRIVGGRAPTDRTDWENVHFSYSQLGEDMVIRHLFACAGIGRGVYVDVGAFHPVRYSNTRYLYDAGWSGVNVDANPAAIALFETQRPRDVNVCAAVSDDEHSAQYVRYASGATNRLADQADAESVLHEAPVESAAVTTRTLTSILETNGVAHVDLLTVDCEGEDVRVLAGFDFERWRPLVVAVEAHTEDERAAVSDLLGAAGYRPVARMVVTEIYEDTRRMDAP